MSVERAPTPCCRPIPEALASLFSRRRPRTPYRGARPEQRADSRPDGDADPLKSADIALSDIPDNSDSLARQNEPILGDTSDFPACNRRALLRFTNS